MALIKICGITNKMDAINASELGVDMLGFVFYNTSKRSVDVKTASDIINELPDTVRKVGVFVNEDKDRVREIARDSGLDTLQFHGDETPEYCSRFKGDYKVIKAFRLKGREDLKVINSYDTDLYLLDTYKPGEHGGTGGRFDWNILKDFEFLKPIILSGGLDPDNVARAISEVAPYCVDVSTGVEESPGKKSPVLLRKFVEEVRKA
ncbi:MAG: phosphoribosylanthranilate isomerase [Candidatus Omnitrophica bacterium]|nr:phosphoribosylanthranilate isomerase [Candidatus Omnitrophota bacterium]MBU1809321.1 phosphoribosylanthranilate isomerase [Candidatus Omnitrophota bacterium]